MFNGIRFFKIHFKLEDNCLIMLCWLLSNNNMDGSAISIHKSPPSRISLPLPTASHPFQSVQFSSVTQSCPTLCNPMDCSTPGLPVHHQLPEFTQTHVHWVRDAIQPSHLLSSSSCRQSFPAAGSLQISQLFAWGGQSIGASASTPVLPMNTQDWSL